MIFCDFVTVTELIYIYTSIFAYLNNVSAFIFMLMFSLINYFCWELSEQLFKSLNNIKR